MERYRITIETNGPFWALVKYLTTGTDGLGNDVELDRLLSDDSCVGVVQIDESGNEIEGGSRFISPSKEGAA